METYSIGPLTSYCKPKYRIITSILGEDFNPTNGVDIYLDLNSVINASASSKKFMNSLPFAEDVEEDIISSVLYIFKHWIDYSKRWKDSRIIMIVNSFEMAMLAEESQLKSYLFPYLHKFSNDRYKQFTYYWGEALRRVEIIMKYIPNCHLIRCNRFDSFIIPNVIDETNKRKRIIVSGNALMTNYHYMPRTHIIYSRYKFTGMSQVSDPKMIVQSMTKIDDEIINTFAMNKVFYNTLNAIIGDYDRGLIGLTQLGISKFAATLLRAVEKHEIPDNPKSIETILPVINPSYHDYLKQSYPLVDIEQHTLLIPESMISNVKSKMVDLYDIDGLSSFTVKGLNLIELL